MLQKNEVRVCLLSAKGNKNNKPLFDRPPPRLLGIFEAWRLRAYSLGIATVYAVVFIHFYRGGGWIINIKGAPIYTDFTTAWVAGVQALQGNVATLYDPAEFLKMQTALLGALDFVYPNWPYPPTFSLLLAPFATLPYAWAFITWDLLTLGGFLSVVYLIARRSPAIALVLASPFTAWNFLAGQNGFLMAALLGGALLFLERQPILAGVFIGCLTYKPQFGILLPVALVAGNQWRAIASALATFAMLSRCIDRRVRRVLLGSLSPWSFPATGRGCRYRRRAPIRSQLGVYSDGLRFDPLSPW